jgi:hypothetical protein
VGSNPIARSNNSNNLNGLERLHEPRPQNVRVMCFDHSRFGEQRLEQIEEAVTSSENNVVPFRARV